MRESSSGKGKWIDSLLDEDSNNCGSIFLEKSMKSCSICSEA